MFFQVEFILFRLHGYDFFPRSHYLGKVMEIVRKKHQYSYLCLFPTISNFHNFRKIYQGVKNHTKSAIWHYAGLLLDQDLSEDDSEQLSHCKRVQHNSEEGNILVNNFK